ncbi:CoA transferase [Thermodesulfobacteriota bacterium]
MNSIAKKVLSDLLSNMGLDENETGGKIDIIGDDPVVPSRHRPGVASAAALAAQGAAVATIWRLRSGRGQDISVDVQRAVVPGLRTTYYVRQNNYSPWGRTNIRMPNFFRTKDDRRIYVLRAPVYPEKLFRTLDLLKCLNSTEEIANAIAGWRAEDLEEAIAEKKLFGVIARTREEWLEHPQGRWLSERPVIEIEKLGNSDPEPFQAAERPLSDIRVLDMTSVLAGPVTSRTLAEQGADVLNVSSPYQQDPLYMVLDTNFGKRAAYIDLNESEDVKRLRELVAGADLFVQSWRPGTLDKYGLSPDDLMETRPGLIYVSVSCYGSGGPWANRGGYEPLGQTPCGLAMNEGSIDAPRLAPTVTLNDYLVPYLGAAGALAALIRRSREGGSYHVKVSLTRTSMWLLELGQISTDTPDVEFPELGPDSPYLDRAKTVFGEVEYASPITQYSETKAFWDKPPVPPGSSQPVWL